MGNGNLAEWWWGGGMEVSVVVTAKFSVFLQEGKKLKNLFKFFLTKSMRQFFTDTHKDAVYLLLSLREKPSLPWIPKKYSILEKVKTILYFFTPKTFL